MSVLHSVNNEQRLYVLESGGGYSCLGFDVAQKWASGVREWLPEGQRKPLDAVPGTAEHYQQYLDLMQAGAAYNRQTGQRCPVQLTPALVGLEGKRVEVTSPGGSRGRFYVGKSTGWMPCHLEIKTRTSRGGCSVYLPAGAAVRVVGSR